MVDIPPIIKKRFAPYIDIPCWAACNKEKVPVQLKNPELNLSWKKAPEFGVVTLPELEKYLSLHVGFGIFTGNGLGCDDFDHFLDRITGKPDYNNKLDDLLNRMPTFAEISSSGEGVHAFFSYDRSEVGIYGEPAIDIKKMGINLSKFLSDEEIRLISLAKDDPERIEKDIKKYMPGGKIYLDNHFIKLTGVPYNENDYPLFHFNKFGLKTLVDKTTITPVLPKPQTPSIQISFSHIPWDDILAENGIPHPIASEYIGKERHGKLQVGCWKIPCPNRHNHQTKRPGDISADLAILTQYSDGSTSLKCNHNTCSPEKRPNLLQKLWDEIKTKNDIREYKEKWS